jgi:hypothetical protein
MQQQQQNNRKQKQDWKEEEVITKGNVQIGIQSLPGNRGGKIYSFFFSRLGKEDRTSKYFRPSDKADLIAAVEECDQWIECDRHEQEQSQNRGHRRAG